MSLEVAHNQEVLAEGISEASEGVEVARRLIGEMLDNHIELGRGNDGVVRVFAEPGKQDFCVKELHEVDAPTMVNNLETEMNLQRQAVSLGVRSPVPILCLATDEEAFMVMETIRGHSLKDIMEQHLPLPEQFNPSQFWAKAKSMIDVLHAGQIYHRDVHPGNLMLEYSTATPVIIDYGRACRAFGDEDPYIQVDVLDRQLNFVDDYEGLRSARLAFTKYLTAK